MNLIVAQASPSSPCPSPSASWPWPAALVNDERGHGIFSPCEGKDAPPAPSAPTDSKVCKCLEVTCNDGTVIPMESPFTAKTKNDCALALAEDADFECSSHEGGKCSKISESADYCDSTLPKKPYWIGSSCGGCTLRTTSFSYPTEICMEQYKKGICKELCGGVEENVVWCAADLSLSILNQSFRVWTAAIPQCQPPSSTSAPVPISPPMGLGPSPKPSPN